MKSIRKALTIYLPFARSQFQTLLAYRVRVLSFVLASLLYILISYYLWKAVFESGEQAVIQGFTFQEMIIYVLLAYAIGSIQNIVATAYMGSEVMDGSIAMNLIRPIQYKTRLLFISIGTNFYNFIFVALPIIIFACIYQPSLLNIKNILLATISIWLGFILAFLFDFCFGIVSFYTTYIWGLQMFKTAVLRFLTGALIPLSFFPDVFQRLFDFLPFSAILYTPVMISMGKMEGNNLVFAFALQIAWILILYLLSRVLWAFAVKRLSILGG